jgi:two-component system sensor histidine kinase CpxA
MKTRARFPLLAKVLGWLSLHLAILGLSFFLFVRWQLGLGLDSLLSGSAGERMSAFADAVITRVSDLPLRRWNEAILPLAEQKHLTAMVFDPASLTDFPRPVPLDVIARARAATPPPRPDPPAGGPRRPPRPDFAPPDDRPPRPAIDMDDRPPRPENPAMPPPDGRLAGDRATSRPVFLMHAGNGDGYWAGVLLHLPPSRNLPRQPVLLLIRADHLDGSGMFFDLKPWLWGGLAVLLLSLAFWTPFVWGITRYLQRLTTAADAIAAGRFHVSLPPRGHDELGNLGRTIESMASRLEHLIAGQKRFLGDAAHELCAPLARIRTGLGILEMKLATADQAALASIEADTAELASLVAEVLAFARAGNRAPCRQAVAVEPLVREVLARENFNSNVEVAIPAGLTIMTDPLLLGRALGNLVRNAAVHAGPQAKVKIHATEEADSITLSVTDDGPGVPPAEIPRLFEPFYRLDRSRSRETGGSGLGLAIVRTAIETCGGQTVASLPENGGFAVSIRLPK